MDKGTETFTWVDPPPMRVGQGRRSPDARRVAMDANPGKWLLYRAAVKHPSGTQYLKKLGYEATTRKREDGFFDLYARKVAE